MIQKSQTQMPLVEDVVLRSNAVQPDITHEGNEFIAPLKNTTLPILAITYWFEPESHSTPYPVIVRFSGYRVDVNGEMSAGDKFVHDEAIEHVIPGSGPISITARIHNINAGEWVVTAHVQESQTSELCESRISKNSIPASGLQNTVTRLWRQWAPSAGEDGHARTCLIPFAHIPGILPGIWGMMVIFGIIVALALQALAISRIHLMVGSSWAISLTAIMVGIMGAKGLYIFLYRRIEGWCIQGFITGASLSVALLLVVLHVPVGAFLDATAPGLLIAMAIGRVGCFFGGCCGGPLTASRWGVWSSDQRVGARRIPTQLLELLLAGILGLGVLVGVLTYGTQGGAFFVGGLAFYTFARQGILHLRAEPSKTKWGRRITAFLAALVFIVTVVLLTR